MVPSAEMKKVATILKIRHLRVGKFLVEDGSGDILDIQYFWLAKFYTLLGNDWGVFTICLLSTKQTYYALLIPEGVDEDEVEIIEIPDWNGAVEQCLQNINIMIYEPKNIFFSAGIYFDFMVSSSSLTTHISVSPSLKPRDSIDDLRINIIDLVKKIIDIHPNKEIINQLRKDK